eukprot:9606239-Ditylum_brightwellii.AAC.1
MARYRTYSKISKRNNPALTISLVLVANSCATPPQDETKENKTKGGNEKEDNKIKTKENKNKKMLQETGCNGNS